ncbi:MAG: hypothetical protein ACYCTE_15765, partial [Acidimicrobiales bacterium]
SRATSSGAIGRRLTAAGSPLVKLSRSRPSFLLDSPRAILRGARPPVARKDQRLRALGERPTF